MIIRLIGGSAQQILRRLEVLFHHGYLDRPTSQVAQLSHAFDFGNRSFLYGLGRAGAGRPVGKIEVDESRELRGLSRRHDLERAWLSKHLLGRHQEKVDSQFSKEQRGYRRTARNLVRRAHENASASMHRLAASHAAAAR